MSYVVRAIHVDGVTGAFTAEKNTRREALELAKSLRERGLWVIITGPDGKTVDETEDGEQRGLPGSPLPLTPIRRTSAPMVPHFVHTMRGPNDGTVRSPDKWSTFMIVSCQH